MGGGRFMQTLAGLPGVGGAASTWAASRYTSAKARKDAQDQREEQRKEEERKLGLETPKVKAIAKQIKAVSTAGKTRDQIVEQTWALDQPDNLAHVLEHSSRLQVERLEAELMRAQEAGEDTSAIEGQLQEAQQRQARINALSPRIFAGTLNPAEQEEVKKLQQETIGKRAWMAPLSEIAPDAKDTRDRARALASMGRFAEAVQQGDEEKMRKFSTLLRTSWGTPQKVIDDIKENPEELTLALDVVTATGARREKLGPAYSLEMARKQREAQLAHTAQGRGLGPVQPRTEERIAPARISEQPSPQPRPDILTPSPRSRGMSTRRREVARRAARVPFGSSASSSSPSPTEAEASPPPAPARLTPPPVGPETDNEPSPNIPSSNETEGGEE